ncbi:hypothetical protein C5167_029400 [Papaver somniferum]|nr:hypothetical protein C5167_029400 [Papaver somniferum]
MNGDVESLTKEKAELVTKGFVPDLKKQLDTEKRERAPKDQQLKEMITSMKEQEQMTTANALGR